MKTVIEKTSSPFSLEVLLNEDQPHHFTIVKHLISENFFHKSLKSRLCERLGLKRGIPNQMILDLLYTKKRLGLLFRCGLSRAGRGSEGVPIWVTEIKWLREHMSNLLALWQRSE